MVVPVYFATNSLKDLYYFIVLDNTCYFETYILGVMWYTSMGL